MLKQIRRKVFETNSSSMHSLSVIGGNRYTDKNNLYAPNGVIEVEGGQYDWEGSPCVTPYEKLDYIVTVIAIKSGYDVAESYYFEWLSEMVKDYTGCTLEFVAEDEDDIYIDHESHGMLDKYFHNGKEEFKDNMKELVFNDKYSIIISNDNSYF